MKKAEITVYLTLTLTVMLSLILALVEGARSSVIQMQIETVADMGLNSVFAEYNREALKQYDLFFIDSSYGMGMSSMANVEAHMKDYMSYNFKPTKETFLINSRDWLALETEELMITEASLATDEKGAVCKRQAVRYMKDKIGLGFVNEWIEQSEVVKQEQMTTQNPELKQNSIRQEIDDKLPMREDEKGELKKVTLDNPADAVQANRGIGILKLALSNPELLSEQSIIKSQYASERKLESGSGLPEDHEAEEGAVEEALFGEYLIEKCGNYRNQQEKSLLKYQLEYILTGSSSDKENLKKTTEKLLALREVSNMISLWKDPVKTAEADAMALVLATAILLPEIQPIIKQSLMLAWAFAESVQDIKILLEGGRVPLLKIGSEWKIGLENMLDFQTSLQGGSGNETGLNYTEYLRLFLLLMNKEEKVIRFLDIVEMDIRKTEGNKKFKIDGCLDSLTVDALVSSRFGYQYQIRRFYCYE